MSITAANVNQAKGNFDGPHQAYQIGANDQMLSSADYASMIIAYRNNGAGARQRCRHGRGRYRERPAGGLDERVAGRDRQYSAAAGREHHRGGGSHQGAASTVAGVAALFDQA